MPDQEIPQDNDNGKMPWSRFFWSNFLAATSGMTSSETGIYIKLLGLMYESEDGWIKDDRRRLARQCGASNSAYKAAFEMLVETGKIIIDNGYLSNKRVLEERSYMSKRSDVARENAKSRWGEKPNKNNGSINATAIPPQSGRICHDDANQNQNHIQKSSPSENNARARQGWFDEFWELYPNKVGKRAAREAFERALKRETWPRMKAGLHRYKRKTDDRPWCHPTTWLNQDRWLDEPAQQPGRLDGVMDLINSLPSSKEKQDDDERGSDRDHEDDRGFPRLEGRKA